MKTRFVALAVAATMGLGSVSAFAQDHHRGGQGGWQQHAQGRGDWGRDHRGYSGYGRNNGNIVGALALGALTGALVSQAANGYNQPGYYAPPATYYSQPPVTYYSPPPATYYNPGYGGYYYGN
jgi:hypothetical protein